MCWACTGLGREGKAGDLMDSSSDGTDGSSTGWGGGVAGFLVAARPCRTPANADAGAEELGLAAAVSSTGFGSNATERGLVGSAGGGVSVPS